MRNETIHFAGEAPQCLGSMRILPFLLKKLSRIESFRSPIILTPIGFISALEQSYFVRYPIVIGELALLLWDGNCS
jgi:hypothetical protein